MIYVYNFESGNVAYDTEPPTDDDILCCNQGLLSVLRTDGKIVEEMECDGGWAPATKCEVIVACGSEFHEVA